MFSVCQIAAGVVIYDNEVCHDMGKAGRGVYNTARLNRLNRELMRRFIPLIVLLLAGCAAGTLPTPTPSPSPTPTPRTLPTTRPTEMPRPVLIQPTASPTLNPATPLPPTATPTVPVVLPPSRTPTETPEPGRRVTIGQSAAGRSITAVTYGQGARNLLLVGGIHGGWEANTVDLMDALAAHYAENTDAVHPLLSVTIIRTMNPDGLAVGRDLAGRFNANGVDLNRNWSCGWQPDAVWREGSVDPGARPFSEPETQAVAAYIGSNRPEAVLFYHSAADGVFAGDCPLRSAGWRSGQLEAVYGEAAGYSYGERFNAYPVTGTAPSWVDGLDIPAVDVELSSSSDPQLERNLQAVRAVQCWLIGEPRNC